MDDPTTPAPIEPSATLRIFASNLRQMFLALVNVGFTEDEALKIIGYTLTATFGSD